MESRENYITKTIPPFLAILIIIILIIVLFGPPAMKAGKASQQALKAEERYEQGLKKAKLIVEKFNRETGHDAKTIQEITTLMRREGLYLDKAKHS